MSKFISEELNNEWSFLIKFNLWRDKKGKQINIQDMCLDYIYNCILFLKGTTCDKYIPDEQLRMRYISLFQNEISRRDTLRKLTNKIDTLQKLNDLLLKWKKENHNWQDIDHSSLKYKDYNSKYEDLIKEMKWKDSEGYIYYIKDMRNGHLANTITYIDRMLNSSHIKTESDKKLFEKYKLLMETELNIRNQIKEVMSMDEYFMTESELLKGKKYQDLEGVMALRCGLDIDELVKINGERFKDEDEDLYTQVDREMRNKPIEEVKKESGRWSGSNINKKDNVNHPNHYAQTRIECIDAIEACIELYQDPVDAYLTSNALKYIWRHPFKRHPVEDLSKACWYLNRLIEKYKEKENNEQ